MSAQQIVVGRQAGLPIPLSPLVAGILDTLANTASYNLPANVVLNQLEVEYKYIEAKAHIGQQVFEFKVADFVQWGQKNWAYLA